MKIEKSYFYETTKVLKIINAIDCVLTIFCIVSGPLYLHKNMLFSRDCLLPSGENYSCNLQNREKMKPLIWETLVIFSPAHSVPMSGWPGQIGMCDRQGECDRKGLTDQLAGLIVIMRGHTEYSSIGYLITSDHGCPRTIQ